MQDDLLFPHLTVKETLTYAALLRLPINLTKTQKKERAMHVINELGLERYVCVSVLQLIHAMLSTHLLLLEY